MKKFFTALALAALAFSALAVPVPSAQVLCSPANIQGASSCSGAFAGTELGSAANLANAGAQFGDLAFNSNLTLFNSPFTLMDTSENTRGSQISLIYETGGGLGAILLKDPTGILNQSIFGIGLKAGNSYSLYVFNGATLSQNYVMDNLNSQWTALTYTTAGTSANWWGIPQNLSHASLWQGPVAPNFGDSCGIGNDGCSIGNVPEPTSLALTLAGLGGLGFVTRRRKTEKA